MSKKYFAYGSCTNLESFKETMKKAGCEDKIQRCDTGTGLLALLDKVRPYAVYIFGSMTMEI